MTHETITFAHASCPCGHGTIEREVESPNNSWSGGSQSFSLACSDCEKIYVMEHGFLYRRTDQEAWRLALREHQKAEEKLESLGKSAIDAIVAAGPSKTYAEEHRMLKEAKLCFEGPRLYKWAREAEAAASEHCRALSNMEWIIGRLQDLEMKGKLLACQKAWMNAERALERAQKNYKHVFPSSVRKTPDEITRKRTQRR